MRSEDGVPAAVMLRWGLVPFWAKDPSLGSRMINARAETLAEKPAFRHFSWLMRYRLLRSEYATTTKSSVGWIYTAMIHRMARWLAR